MDATRDEGWKNKQGQATRRLLVVEDDPDVARALEGILAHPLAELEFTDNGGDALDRIRRVKPHLVVLDVKLPVMDGFELFQTMRRDPALRGIPVIFVTAHMPRGALDMAREPGAVASFSKPFQPEALRMAVLETLGLAGNGGGGAPRPAAQGTARRAGVRPHVALVSSEPLGQVVG